MPYDVPHTVSPSLWALAWRRLRADRVAMISLAIVAAFLVMMVLSATGLIAKDWGVESGVNYAPPSFLGEDLEQAKATKDATPARSTAADTPTPLDINDPLADALAEIRGQSGQNANAAPSDVVDPLADVMAEIRAKGVGENRIMWVHVLRNASIPIITHVMAEIPGLLIGAFLIESFFSIPGIGREVLLAVNRSDFPVIKAITIYVAVATMIFNLLADLTYKAADPRVQLK